MPIHHDLLTELGLSEGEAVIYEVLLDKGKSSAIKILPETNLTRPNLYYNLGLLKEKGLIIETPGKKRLFEAVSPKRLDDLAAEKMQMAKATKNRLHAALPDLISLFTLSTEKPVVWHRGGIQGLKDVYKDILETADDLLIFPSTWDRVTPEIDALIDQQIKQQAKKGIRVRVIFHAHENLTRDAIADLRRVKIDPRILYDADLILPSQVLIWDDKVGITNFRNELSTTVVQNAETSTTMKKIFEVLWKYGKADVKEALAD